MKSLILLVLLFASIVVFAQAEYFEELVQENCEQDADEISLVKILTISSKYFEK